MKREVTTLIRDLQDACHRSLYDGNGIGCGTFSDYRSAVADNNLLSDSDIQSYSSSTAKNPAAKRRRRYQLAKTRSWEALLSEAAELLPSMTQQEHGMVSKLASILLLGFFLPHSTGNDFFLLQSMSEKKNGSSLKFQTAGSNTSEGSTRENIQEYILTMPLEERLECAAQRFNPNEFGEFDSIVHDRVNSVFRSFLTRALAPFLSTRPAHTQMVDLIHILAMAIHPQPSYQTIGQTADQLDQIESCEWTATKRLMASAVPHSFQINYNHRLEIVRIVSDFLMLPEYDKMNAGNDAPLFEGALPHLRASLYAFGMAAVRPCDAHWAQCGLVSVTIQTGIDYVIKEEWGRLLHRHVDDQINYNCGCSLRRKRRKTFSLMTQDEGDFCPHKSRGDLLQYFLSRFNESRHYADMNFLQHALSSLTDAIEWQVDCWTKSSSESEDDDEDVDETTSDPPCMLSSLLFAAKYLFYFLLPIVNVDDRSGEESEESHRRDMLVSCSIQLLHHKNSRIACEASALLVLAFCYGPDDMVNDYASAMFSSTKLGLEIVFKAASTDDDQSLQKRMVFPIEQIVATISHKSEAYADSMFTLLLSTEQLKSIHSPDDVDSCTELVCRLIASVASACPSSGHKHIKRLIKILETRELPDSCATQIAAAILSSRKDSFFLTVQDSVEKCFDSFLPRPTKDAWSRFILARHAMATGNFDVAKSLYAKLVSIATSEAAFVWLSVLDKVAEAEASLAFEAAQGIPLATARLGSAKYVLTSLSSMSRPTSISFSFQIKLLELRLDFLDVVAVVRQLTREMRLTGVGPKKNTRPNLHLQNAVKCFDVLATKYLSAYRHHGLFVCQQSRTSLRTLHALCRFVASATRCTFVDELPLASSDEIQMKAIKALTLPKGDSCHPLTILMGRLDSAVLQHVDASIDGKIRAAALLEILDGVLKCPAPFPKAFVETGAIKSASFKLSIDPDSADSVAGDDSEFDDEIEISPGTSFTYFASGNLPLSMLNAAKIPFSMVLVWHQITSLGGDAGDDTNAEEKSDDAKNDPLENDNPPPSASALSSIGTFFEAIQCGPFPAEGRFVLSVWLGCRDVRGGEWVLPMEMSSYSIRIRVK